MSKVSTVKHLNLDSTLVASSQQVSCEVANEAVLLSMHDGEYYGLNEVAASIWRLIQHPRSVLEVRDALLEEYSDISPDECHRALLDFVHELIALKMVELR
jgi:hypothetical protein